MKCTKQAAMRDWHHRCLAEYDNPHLILAFSQTLWVLACPKTCANNPRWAKCNLTGTVCK